MLPNSSSTTLALAVAGYSYIKEEGGAVASCPCVSSSATANAEEY